MHGIALLSALSLMQPLGTQNGGKSQIENGLQEEIGCISIFPTAFEVVYHYPLSQKLLPGSSQTAFDPRCP